jgi:hypothetical protein
MLSRCVAGSPVTRNAHLDPSRYSERADQECAFLSVDRLGASDAFLAGRAKFYLAAPFGFEDLGSRYAPPRIGVQD